MTETYHGPTSLRDALAASDPSPASGGMRVALSCPDGDWLAVQVRGTVRVRRLNRRSGHGGSVLGTGEWKGEDEMPDTLGWRPG